MFTSLDNNTIPKRLYKTYYCNVELYKKNLPLFSTTLLHTTTYNNTIFFYKKKSNRVQAVLINTDGNNYYRFGLENEKGGKIL